MASAPVHTKPANDDDNQPRFRWPPRRRQPQYDLWYAVVQHPTRPIALWCRYTLLHRVDGRSEGRLWAIVSDEAQPQRPVLTTQRFELGRVTFDRDRFGLHLADAGFLSNGLATGRLPAPCGEVGWELDFAPAGNSFTMLGSRRLARWVAPTGYYTTNPSVRARGAFWVGADRIELAAAPMTQGHLFGQRLNPHFVWCTCPSFDNAPASYFEALAAELVPGRVSMTCQLVLDGEAFRFNSVSDVLGPLVSRQHGTRAQFSLGRWTFVARNSRVTVSGEVIGDRAPFRLVRYLSPDGSSRFNNHQSRAALRLTVRRVDGTTRELVCSERASFDFVASQPAPGCPDSAYQPLFD